MDKEIKGNQEISRDELAMAHKVWPTKDYRFRDSFSGLAIAQMLHGGDDERRMKTRERASS